MLILLISKAELEREKERKRQSKVLPSMHGFTPQVTSMAYGWARQKLGHCPGVTWVQGHKDLNYPPLLSQTITGELDGK